MQRLLSRIALNPFEVRSKSAQFFPAEFRIIFTREGIRRSRAARWRDEHALDPQMSAGAQVYALKSPITIQRPSGVELPS